MSFVQFENVIKEYGSAKTMTIRALDGASFNVEEGSLCVILGASGAGKTTALNILGGMDTATSGNVYVGGKNLTALSEKELIRYRRLDIGFVFQFYNLVPNLTALENVELATQICPNSLDCREVLKKVGLGARMGNFPAQLSGGEQQRVAIARALAKNPKLLLCDEPTGALDYNTGKQILQLLQDTCRNDGITVIIITHNSALSPMADRVIRFKSGKITSVTDNDEPTPISEIEW
ncbi:MAG: ABC transporter ATP-binding protein [Lachnospiraceae bacterium]|nr:ABC transporter ATP-binding protein [Lachnospiraceae bacterium]